MGSQQSEPLPLGQEDKGEALRLSKEEIVEKHSDTRISLSQHFGRMDVHEMMIEFAAQETAVLHSRLSQLQSERKADAERIAALERERDDYRKALQDVADSLPWNHHHTVTNPDTQKQTDVQAVVRHALLQYPHQSKP